MLAASLKHWKGRRGGLEGGGGIPPPPTLCGRSYTSPPPPRSGAELLKGALGQGRSGMCQATPLNFAQPSAVRPEGAVGGCLPLLAPPSGVGQGLPPLPDPERQGAAFP